MYYCMFENASKDINAMCWAIEEGHKTSERECEKAEYVFECVLDTMRALGVIDDYDGEKLYNLCQEMNENNAE